MAREAGAEQEFIEAWGDLAEWTLANVEGCTFAKLLQDEADGRHFLSFSPWSNEAAIAAWREEPGFQRRVQRLQELLESFAPAVMDVAAEAGSPTPDPW